MITAAMVKRAVAKATKRKMPKGWGSHPNSKKGGKMDEPVTDTQAVESNPEVLRSAADAAAQAAERIAAATRNAQVTPVALPDKPWAQLTDAERFETLRQLVANLWAISDRQAHRGNMLIKHRHDNHTGRVLAELEGINHPPPVLPRQLLDK